MATFYELKECNYSKDQSQRNNVRDPSCRRLSRVPLPRLSARNLNIDGSIHRLTSVAVVFATFPALPVKDSLDAGRLFLGSSCDAGLN